MGQAVVEVKTLLARYYLVPVQEALQRLVVDAVFEFRVAEIENALEHGGRVSSINESRLKYISKAGIPYLSPPLCASLTPTATQIALFFGKAPRRRGWRTRGRGGCLL